MIFFWYGPGALFLLLGLFMVIRGIRQATNQRRLLQSGLGSMLVGLGNIVIPYNWPMGLAVVGLGVCLIYQAARMGAQA